MADMTLGKGVDDMVGPDVQVSERIQQAMDMAKAFHEGQMRRGNEKIFLLPAKLPEMVLCILTGRGEN